MHKILLTAGLMGLCCFSLSAASPAKADSLKTWDDRYKEEQGFFKKAYRDVTDPTFMFTDAKGDFSIGIGGMVLASAYYDFNGSIDSPMFNTAQISVPSYKSNHFGYTTTGSDIFVKARGTRGKHKLAAYLEIQNYEGNIFLNQAYVSLDRFTIGQTYSFFEDLEAGVRTVDLRGPNTQVENIHPLVGFTSSIGKNFKYGISLEQPSEISSTYSAMTNCEAEYSRYPDIAAYLKFGGKVGHIQVSGLLCERSYHATPLLSSEGKSFYKECYGVSVSGTIVPVKGLTISGQAVGGRGISKYIKELSSLDDDMLYERKTLEDGYPVLTPAPVYGGYIGASYRISPSLEASTVFGYSHLAVGEDQDSATDFKESYYVTANLFCFLSSRCMAGFEYAYGKKLIYTDLEDNSGIANRLNACFIYRF